MASLSPLQYRRPIKIETRQVLAETIGVIDLPLVLSRLPEELPPRLGKRARTPADTDYLRELHTVEGIDPRESLSSDEREKVIR